MKKFFILMLFIILLLPFLLCGCKSEEARLRESQNIEIYELAYQGDITQAKEKVQKYYENDEIELEKLTDKINSIADFMEENDSTYQRNDLSVNTTNKLKCDLIIQEDWNSTVEDGYTYINGSVTNKGNKVIGYYKITAKYFDDNHNVVHSNYTNSIEKLYPNENREFEIMNKYNGYSYSKLVIEEVRYE